MERLGFVLTAPCSGGERIGAWLSNRRSVFVTENMLFGRFCELWPDDRGQMLPSITVDRFVSEWSRAARLGPLGMDRAEFQGRFLDEMIELIVAFGLKHSGRQMMLDLVMPFPGTQAQVEAGIIARCPTAPRIKLVRDGRDVLIDQAFRWLLKDSHGTNRYGFFVERRPNVKLTRFLDDAFLERWARVWNDVSLTRLSGANDDSLATITYEAWSADPNSVLQWFTNLLSLVPIESPAPPNPTETQPLSSSDSTSSASTAAANSTANGNAEQKGARQDRLLQRIRRIALPFRTSMGAWREFFTREDGRQFQALAGKALQEHGYVDDPKWFESLPTVLDPERLEAVARSGDEEPTGAARR